MRKIVLNLALSLDGYIEGPNGEYDWCFTDQDYGMTEFLARTDALLLGRKSFDMMQRDLSGLFRDKTWYVFSTTLTEVPQGMHLIGADWEEAVRALKKQPGGDLWLFGGAVLTAHLLRADLVDELLLSVHPVLLGGGTPLFQRLDARTWLEWVDTKTYPSGLVQLQYQRKTTHA
jgi:dihydrofolate reductase